MLGNALLVATCPVVLAPAMHTEMWLNPATQANVATLRERGVTVIEPAVGRLTGADSGPGRLPEPEDLVAALYAAVEGGDRPETDEPGWGDLYGRRVVVTAGGTREPLDPVRYIGNRSSGLQGFALAEAARERGADVTLIAANVVLPSGEGITRIDVETTAQLETAVSTALVGADVVIMAAAVADFRPAHTYDAKIKKSAGGLQAIKLTETTDILAHLVAHKTASQVIVGFAAETGDDRGSVLEHGAAKARRKGADLLAVNPVGGGQGFGSVDNSVTLMSKDGEAVGTVQGTKLAVAHVILDHTAQLLG
jgi:phosphopantothenoylcysteine decarboxylase/phosphopantothenate--cysteine ligase